LWLEEVAELRDEWRAAKSGARFLRNLSSNLPERRNFLHLGVAIFVPRADDSKMWEL
jgi:hypothetical protein